MNSDPANRVVNARYELLREIGRGGMAVIWAAHDALLDRRVALKLLHPQFARDPEFLERFRREARAAAGLNHPNVVGVYDVGVDADTGEPFLVLELVEGESLKERIIRAGPLREADARAIAAAVAEALEYAHRRGVVHRDVKPQNILLGRDGRPRLTDFGIAQAVSTSQLTRTGAVMGSVHYLAPELARGQSATSASDVYSLGVVLYEMATGRVPFTGDTDMAVALAHVEREPAPPRSLRPGLSHDLEATILRALAKRPEERFGSAAALAGALRGAAGAGSSTRVVPLPVPTAGPGSRTELLPPVGARRAAARPGGALDGPPPRRRAVQRQASGGAGLSALLLVLAAALGLLGVGFFGLASLSRGGFGGPPAPAAATATRPPASPTVALAARPTTAPTATATGTATSSPAPTATEVPATATPRPATPTVVPTPTVPPPTPTPQRIAVPRVVGQRQPEAVAALRAAGLSSTVRPANVNAEAGIVATQSPDPGAPLPPGGSVTLGVATGQVAVPEVAGKTEQEALRTLYDAGFRVPAVQQRQDRTVPAGRAIGTNPEAGKLLSRGANVDLYMSSGAPR